MPKGSSSTVITIEGFSPILGLDGSIAADRRLFEVCRTSRQIKVLKAIASQKSGILRKDELIGVIYDDILETDPSLSLRRIGRRYQTAVKTISRLRIELEKFFGDISPPGFGWLPWRENLQGWILYNHGPVNHVQRLMTPFRPALGPALGLTIGQTFGRA
jgi:hypothetical protein